MLSSLIGVFDFPSMLVMVAFFLSCGGVIMVLLSRKRKADYQMQAKELEFKHQESMGIIARDGDIARAKIQQNLITSHKSEDN